ncbi:unnamed protein product [Rhizophagus irregularis]|nr:unnamed protein product [Rhizophagus irregularis]
MSQNKKKSSNKRKLHKASKKVYHLYFTIPKKLINTETNQYEKSAAKNKTPDEEIVKVDREQALTTPNTGQTSTPKKSRYIDCFALLRSVIQRSKNKTPDEEIVEVDRGQASTTPNTGQTSTPKKVDILIVLRYSVLLFKANRDELSDEVEIVKVAREQTSTTPATGQVYQKNYRDPFVLDISQVLIESRQKSKTSRDLEESHTDKEMASVHFLKSSFKHTRTIKP